MCKFDHGNDAVVLEDSRGYQPGLPGLTEPYVPGIPAVPGGGISYPPPLLSVPPPGETSQAPHYQVIRSLHCRLSSHRPQERS